MPEVLTQSQKQDVLRFIQSYKGHSFTFREVVRFLDLDSSDRRSLQHHLDELDVQGVIHRVRRGRYSLPRREALVAGVLSCHKDGYGFVAPDDRGIHRQDIFVHKRNMDEAMHGDRVLLKVAVRPRTTRRRRGADPSKNEAQERLEGTVVRVLERRHPRIVGRYYEHPRFPYVAPLDPRMLHDIQILPRRDKRAEDGQIVVAALIAPPGRHQPAGGEIVEILGYPGDPGLEYRVVEHKFGLPVEFGREALLEAEAMPDRVEERDLEGREDFRGETCVTIDGEDARDYDDAVSLERLPSGGFLLTVHIADVSHYVRPGSAIDSEAFARGTSVYFPDRAIPMLPHSLSSGICSLNPGEDRLVFSVRMEVGADGDVVRSSFARGVIRSCERMTYASVARILEDRDEAERNRYRALVPRFELMEDLCRILWRKRRRRGAVDFDLPEAEIRFDDAGRIISVLASERTIAHRIIEEFMLLANETVAERLTASGSPALYRVHQQPDRAKVEEFAEFALALGYRLEGRKSGYQPKDFQRFCDQLEGKPEGRFLAYLMLRSFMQARYSAENLGHFGLAAPQYTHFTSPIRRYPDLVVHRLLESSLRGPGSASPSEDSRERLGEIARHSSARERNAEDAEREIERIKKVQFMSDKVGDEFDAVIFSVVRQGFYVELLDHFVEGFVPAATLIDDDYHYKEKSHSFVGSRHRRHFKLGSRVKVRLDIADRETQRLAFSMA